MTPKDAVKVECPACGQKYTLPFTGDTISITCESCSAEFMVEPIDDSAESAPESAAPPPTAWVSGEGSPQKQLQVPDFASFIPRNVRRGTPDPRSRQMCRTPWAFLYDVRIFLGWLADGSLIRNVTAFSIYTAAVLAGLACLYGWGQSMKFFSHSEGFVGLLGCALWMVFFPYSCYLAISTAWVRAGDIRKLPSGEFAISPVLSILVNLLGEIIFIICAAWSVPIALLSGAFFGFLPAEFRLNGFMLGVALFLMMWVVGYIVYLVARWIQEMIFVFPSMAHHLDLIEKHLRKETKP